MKIWWIKEWVKEWERQSKCVRSSSSVDPNYIGTQAIGPHRPTPPSPTPCSISYPKITKQELETKLIHVENVLAEALDAFGLTEPGAGSGRGNICRCDIKDLMSGVPHRASCPERPKKK